MILSNKGRGNIDFVYTIKDIFNKIEKDLDSNTRKLADYRLSLDYNEEKLIIFLYHQKEVLIYSVE